MPTSHTDNPHNALSALPLPEQTLTKLSFCGSKPRQLQQWLEQLPTTQAKHTSVLLYKLLPEINQLSLSGSQRLGLLCILRPYVNHCIDGLVREFLKQPLHLTDSLNKIAAIAQALQRHLSDGYLLAARQLANQPSLPGGALHELSLAVYYGIHGLGELYYRSCQLYIPRPPLLWLKLNCLYQLALDYQLADITVQDELLAPVRRHLSAKHAYIRTLALACSNTNQLRQVDVHYIHQSLLHWAPLIQLTATENEHAIYWIDINADKGPFYKKREQNSFGKQLCGIDFQRLLSMLDDRSITPKEQHTDGIPSHLRSSLLMHLTHCWTQPRERRHARKETSLQLDICIGLKAAHQQLLKGTSFNHFMESHNPTDQLPGMNIPIVDEIAYESEPESTPLKAQATDISEDGYCLRWDHNIPPQVKTGEVILLRHCGNSDWQAGIIRWAQRLNKHTYVGVQRLPGHVEASAACTTLANGVSTPFFRTLRLHNASHDTSSSLVTPSVPFAAKQHIQLHTTQEDEKALLTQLLMSSGSISHYAYRPE